MGGENVSYHSVPEKEKICEATDLKEELVITAPKGFGVRHMQTLILFVSVTALFTVRAQLSIAMVAMTNTDTSTCVQALVEVNVSNVNLEENGLPKTERQNCTKNLYNSKWSVYKTYDWNKKTQEIILFAFFIGYTLMMIPMGLLAQRCGGKLPMVTALAVNGVISILTPWIPIFAGWIGVVLCRFLQGMTQAALYPSVHTFLSKWAPISERGRLSTYVYCGSAIGTIFIFQIGGLIAGIPSMGWPSIFWLCGVLNLIGFGTLATFGAATPHDHPTITNEEVLFITDAGSVNSALKKHKTPWKYILTSTAVWGLIATHCGSTIGYVFVLTQIPTYTGTVLGVDIKLNGLFSSLPYIAMFILVLVFGNLADFCVNRNFLSTVNVRRLMNSIGNVISGAFLIFFGYVESTTLAVILMIITLGLHSGIFVGYQINHIDLSPNFAGPIMAFGNTLANLSSLLVPVIVSNIIQNDVTNQSRWQIVIIILALIQFITNTIFVIFVKGTVQPWNSLGLEEAKGEEMITLKTV